MMENKLKFLEIISILSIVLSSISLGFSIGVVMEKKYFNTRTL